MDRIGFSTGAVALSDFQRALSLLRHADTGAVEMSALRFSELQPLLGAIPSLDLSRFGHVSVHAPSAFPAAEEPRVAAGLREVAARGWPVVLHPDAIHRFDCWKGFGDRLCIENMDKRKPVGRTMLELAAIFDRLPDASLCFDVAHARQVDSSMTEAFEILREFGSRIAQVHVSELDARSRHQRLSWGAIHAYRQVAEWLPDRVPLILETPVAPDQIDEELDRAREAFGRPVREAAFV